MGTLGREPTRSALGDKEWEIALELGSEKEGGPIPERFSLNNQTTCRVPMSLLAGVCHSGWWNNSMLLGGVSETVLKECAFCYLFFYFCSLFFIKNFFFLLYNTVLVLPYIDMNLPRVYMSSQSWTPLPYHLSGSTQCTSPKHPVSCIEPRLAIRFLYVIIHVSMPFSH